MKTDLVLSFSWSRIYAKFI